MARVWRNPAGRAETMTARTNIAIRIDRLLRYLAVRLSVDAIIDASRSRGQPYGG